MPDLRHFDRLNTASFVTFSCFHRYRLLTNPTVIQTFIGQLDEWRDHNKVALLGYVVMPEHVHLVLHPPNEIKLGVLIGQLKSRSARIMLPLLRERGGAIDRLQIVRNQEERLVFWQSRCYDHNCRTPDKVREKILYCHKNPVKRGLVGSPEEWRWSSYNWYEGRRDVPIRIDETSF